MRDHWQKANATILWSRRKLRRALQQVVPAHLGHKWYPNRSLDLSDRASHACAILTDGEYAVFAKYSDASEGLEQFEIEAASLRLLSRCAGVRTPRVLGVVPVAWGGVLVLEAVDAVAPGPRHWREVGRTLARIHRVEGERFGLGRPSYLGRLYQDNTPLDSWPCFFAERRLLPALRLAIDSGNVPRETVRQVERLIGRLPALCGPDVAPVLVHGDAQRNNFIPSAAGVVVIDPALYYGHPEMDLASIDCFRRVPDDVFDAYREMLPIDPGFWERRDLWRVWGYLTAASAEGGDHLERLARAVRKYL